MRLLLPFILFCSACEPTTSVGFARETSSLVFKQKERVNGPSERPTAKELNRTSLDPGKLVIREPFRADSVLHQLFPGNYQRMATLDEKDSLDVIWWLCRDCELTPYVYAFWTDPDEHYYFPDSAWNTTLLLQEKHVTIGRDAYVALSFFHTQETVPEFCGRFSGAPTGMALFVHQGSTYTLTNFAAVLNSYGSFGRPIYPEILRAGDDTFIVDMTTYNGGAGGAYTEVKEVYIPSGRGFNRVLRETFLSCVNTHEGEWRTSVHLSDTLAATGYSDLQLITTGDFYGSGFYGDTLDDWLFADAPDAFKSKAYQAIEDSTCFSFELFRTYHFKRNAYFLVSSTMRTKAIETPTQLYQPAWVLE